MAFGPMKKVWALTIKIQPGLWEGCLWDWVVHHNVWEVAPPSDMAKRYVLTIGTYGLQRATMAYGIPSNDV